MGFEDLKARCEGRWPEIISAVCIVDPAILDGGHHPCPKCGGRKRFNLCREGTGGIFCNDCNPSGTGDGIGTIEWFLGCDCKTAVAKIKAHVDFAAASSVTDSEKKLRHDVYSRLAKAFPLAEHHREQLRARGIPDKEIDARGYWSAPLSKSIALQQEFAREEWEQIGKHVPGVFPRGAIKLMASESLMIPVRSRDGRIAGLQVRPDRRSEKDAKYFWLSSKDEGVSPGSPCHVALAPANGILRPNVVRITEGPLKADISTIQSGILTLAVAGVNNWRVAADEIEQTRPATVLLAFDADASTNPGVAKATVGVFEHLSEKGFSVHLESWDSQHKGIDDALQAGAPIQVLSVEDTAAAIKQLKKVAVQKPKSLRLRNYKLVRYEGDDPNKQWERAPIPVPEIAKALTESQGGWPKSCRGVLFIRQGEDEIRELKQPNELFGWIGSTSPVDFHNRNGCISKNELFAELPHHVERFDATEQFPHFPPLPRHFYAKQVQPGDGKRLQQFLDFFSPATKFDRELILAFVATVFWGGSPGRRVAFGVDSVGGTGSGKSELVKRIASLVGGCYELDAKNDEADLRRKLVNGETHRVALIDNIKESCMSSAIIESMITSAWVGGHKLNFGYTKRPNTVTWAMTMNGMSLSRDLAQRTVVIKMDQPARVDGKWDDNVDQFVQKHQEEIIADVAAFFQREPAELSRFTRWASWERNILARCENPEALQKLIESRSGESDQDRETAQSILEYFSDRLSHYGFDPDSDRVHVPTRVATEWLSEAVGKEFNKRSASSTIKNLIDGGSIKNFKPNPSRKNGRGWVWNFDLAPTNQKNEDEETIDYSLLQQITWKENVENKF